MIFKCKNCGGNTVYSPEKHKMYCPYCESEDSHEVQEDAEKVLNRCPNCGGEVPVEEHTSATQCPYCDNYIILDERVEADYQPKLIIPFQMGKESCKQTMRDRFKKFLFAPVDFLSEAKLNHIRGDYVPFWFYDYDTRCEFKGEGTKVRSWTTGDIRYTETSYYNIIRDMDIDYRKIPIDASIQMPDEIMDKMEPYNYEQLTDFQPQYLSGFFAEKYNMPADLIEFRAKTKMKNSADAILSQSYSEYSKIKIAQRNIEVQSSDVRFGLIPVWRYIYQYKDKQHLFYVNGQTGKIIGTPPLIRSKMYCYAGTLAGCLTLILLLLQYIV